MKIKDHFLSQEIFEVRPSQHQGILQTFPQPKEECLSKYYDSPTYISHQTQAKSFKDKVYQKVKSFMIKKKKKMVLKHYSQGHILDIGAGTGEFLDVFEDKYWKKFCIEPFTKLHPLLYKKDIQLKENLEQIGADFFEVITLWHSLEHIPNLEQTILHLKRVLKPGGIIIVAVPNYKSYDAQFFKQYWAAWDVPRHLWHFSREGLKTIFSHYNFKCIRDKGMPFDAFYVSMLSAQYKPNTNLLSALCIACLSNLNASFNKEHSSVMYVLRQ